MEFFYATMTACEIAYYTYIYAKVDKEHYQRVTSHMRAAALTGRFSSATTSQLVLSFGLLTVADLNHLTFAGKFTATFNNQFSPDSSCCFVGDKRIVKIERSKHTFMSIKISDFCLI